MTTGVRKFIQKETNPQRDSSGKKMSENKCFESFPLLVKFLESSPTVKEIADRFTNERHGSVATCNLVAYFHTVPIKISSIKAGQQLAKSPPDSLFVSVHN